MPQFQLFLESIRLSPEHASRHELERIVVAHPDELPVSPERFEQMTQITKHIVGVVNRGKSVAICAD
jgi:hypothetical protein